jgi:hypothetical protein
MNKGKITISRFSGTNTIQVQIEDATSGIEFLRVELDAEALGLTLTGLGRQDCAFRMNGLDKIGKQREIKTEVVFVPTPPSYQENDRRANAQAAIAPYEVDGWIGYVCDAMNHHRSSRYKDGVAADGGSWYTVSFTRFVDATDPTPT